MRLKNRLFWIVAITGLILDQLSKYWVTQNCVPNIPQKCLTLLTGVFNLTYVTNTGAAFSLFTGNVEWLRWLSLAVSLGLMALAWFGVLNVLEQLGYGFILGGALGNGIDRFFAGRVVDFLDFQLIHFPIFNVADVLINIGLVYLLIATFKRAPASNRRIR